MIQVRSYRYAVSRVRARFFRAAAHLGAGALTVVVLFQTCEADQARHGASHSSSGDERLVVTLERPAECRNEPDGFVPIESRTWEEKPPSRGWGASPSAERRMAIHVDGQEAGAPTRVLRGVFPPGFGGGNAPFSTGYRLEGAARFPRIYVCQWTRHSSNFVNHPTGSKHLWFMLEGVSAWNGATSVYSAHDGPNMRVQINLQNQPWGNRNLTPNRGSNRYIRDFLGEWVKYEYLLELNRDGASDGRVRVWINDDLILSYDDVKFLSATDPRHWSRVRWQPTYGGVGHEVPYEQYQDMTRIYISGGRDLASSPAAPRPE